MGHLKNTEVDTVDLKKMTRKSKTTCYKNSTKLLFEISHNSGNIFRWKTYSDASPFSSKSLVMQLKQKLPNTRYYEDQGTLKRDLSIETDICILRRYYKKNRKKLLNKEALSARSNNSLNHTKIDTINEFTRDSSAYGENSELTNKQEKLNINLPLLVVNILTKLLNDWIKKYLLEINQTKQKIDSFLESILHKFDFQQNKTSSCKYTVDVELGDQSSKPDSISGVTKNFKFKPEERVVSRHREYVKNRQKSSYLTIPLNNKYQQVISTLSIPRKKIKVNKSKSVQKNKKNCHKKLLSSISKSNKYLLRNSSLDFLTLRTKSLTKRCATYERNDREIFNCPNYLVIQKPCYKNHTYSISDKIVSPNNFQDINVQKVNSMKIPSIYKNMYNFTPADIISYENKNTYCSDIIEDQGINVRQISPNNTRQQNQKITDERKQSDQLIIFDSGKQNYEISDMDIKSSNKLEVKLKSSKNIKNKTGSRIKNLFNGRISEFQTYKSIKSKQFTYLFKKSNKNNKKEKKLLNHLQSILKYLSNYGKDKDIQFYIQITVCPVNGSQENTITKSYTNIKYVNIKENDRNNIPPLYSQNIILLLLDKATNQSKYIVSKETSTDLKKESREKDIKISENQIDNSKMSQRLDELRVNLKSPAMSAEKPNQVLNEPNSYSDDFPVDINPQPRGQIVSGFKLRKEANKKHFSPHQIKENTSYIFNPSESVLKITDMTSAAQNIIAYKTMTDEALARSLSKSKSLLEIAVDRTKKKLLVFYCEDFVKPDDHIYNVCERNTPCFSNQPRFPCYWVKPKHVYSQCHMDQSCCDNTCPRDPQSSCTEFVPENDDGNSCSSLCCYIDSKTCTQKVTIRNCEELSFCEGFLYCVLLWIPVMVISWLFYVYVIEDLIAPREDSAKNVSTTQPPMISTTQPPMLPLIIRASHGSIVPSLTLSDLGF